MQIQKINLNKNNTIAPSIKTNNQSNNKAHTKSYTYNPMAYKDYNVNFGERLFRTPANFFEQDFNRNNMPLTMKKYLFADYEDRQNMPPAQMLKLVFGDINIADNLEDVKYLYPEESLFKDLSDTPNIKARKGVLAEIDMMKEADKSLFKNGEDNLGFYLLKKIYLEGKSLKEINHDFKRDISVYYDGISPIQYDTLAAYGIKFPKSPFWKSFTATREDFPYTYKPRKPLEERESSYKAKTSTTSNSSKISKKKFENINDWQIDKLANALIEGRGDKGKTAKHLKRNSTSDPEALGFVAKYMSEINSVVLEKLHVSEEMKDFFENYENLSDSQKIKFKKYWDDEQIRNLRSTVMKATILYFMEAYGYDGNNEEFQDLIKYAHSIKPNRIEAQEKHNQLQAEYEKIFADYDPEEALSKALMKDKPIDEIDKQIDLAQIREKKFEQNLKDAVRQANGELYQFKLSSGHTISIVANFNEMIEDKVEQEMPFYPKQFKDNFYCFLSKKCKEDPKYMISLFYNIEDINNKYDVYTNNNANIDQQKEDIELFKKEYLYDNDEIATLNEKYLEEYCAKYYTQFRAAYIILQEILYRSRPSENIKDICKQAVKDTLSKENPDMPNDQLEKLANTKLKKTLEKYSGKNIYRLDPSEMYTALNLFDIDPKQCEEFIESRYSTYNKPLSTKEIQKIAEQIADIIYNYDPSQSITDDQRTINIICTISKNMHIMPAVKKLIVKILTNYGALPPKYGDLRSLILNSDDKVFKNAMGEQFLIDFVNRNTKNIIPLLAINRESLDTYIAPVDRALYENIAMYRISKGLTC